MSLQNEVFGISTKGNRYTIIDEADEMVSADWVEDMKKIMSGGGRIKWLPPFLDRVLT